MNPTSPPTRLLDAHAVALADRPAVIWHDGAMTFSELRDAVRYTANRLVADGVGRDNVVGVTLADEVENLVVTLALFRIGCTHIALPSYESATVRSQLARQAGCDLVVSTTSHGNDLPALVRPAFGRDGHDVLEDWHPAPDDVAMYLASSGTTGRAKIVPVAYGILASHAQRWEWPLERFVLYRPNTMEFNNGRKQRIYNFLVGGANVLAAGGPGTDLFDVCRRHAVTRIILSTAQARSMIAQARETSDRLPEGCRARIGGSMVDPGLRRAFMDHVTPALDVTYAATEAGTLTFWRPEHWAVAPASVGLPHPRVEIQIVDENGTELPRGQQGRIRIRADDITPRYVGDEEATARAFRDGWFHPGDAGVMTAEGLLTVVGRVDDMMSIASINVFPSEIETVVAEHPAVLDCAAFAGSSRAAGQIPLVALVAVEGTEPGDIVDYAREKLGVRAPRRAFLVDAIPRNALGKIDRNRLREQFATITNAPARDRTST